MKLGSDSGARSSSRHQLSREAVKRRHRLLLEVDRGEHGVRQPAAEQGDAGFVLLLAAAADQAAGIAAEQQAVAERRTRRSCGSRSTAAP